MTRSRRTKRDRAQRRIETLLSDAGHVSTEPPPPNRSCHGKRQYSERLARIVAAEQSDASGQRIEAYACLWCPAWHIGHPLRSTP